MGHLCSEAISGLQERDSCFPSHDANARHERGTHILRRYQDCKNGIRAFPLMTQMLVMNGAPTF